MTPAERIAAAVARVSEIAERVARPYLPKIIGNVATDALCPKGERVVLDRTGDTDRLIRQRYAVKPGRLGLYIDADETEDVWVDVDSDGAS